MKKTGIMTDSHSGILNEEAEKTWNQSASNAILYRRKGIS